MILVNKKPGKLFLQYVIPHHAYSRLMGWLSFCRWLWLKNYLIGLFIARYQVDMRDAEILDPYEHPFFNAFFTRALKKEARPLPFDQQQALSPVDGAVIEVNTVHNDSIIHVKGQAFNAHALLGGSKERTLSFEGGDLISFYLAPRDYHRVHMPVTGQLREMVYIPGRLFSVNPLTTRYIPDVLSRNERVVCIFDTERGPMAIVLVGAMIVGSIETVWAGVVAASTPRKIKTFAYNQELNNQVSLQRGEEMGRFQVGSTVVVLFAAQAIRLAKTICADAPVKMGQAIGAYGAGDE